MIYSFAPALSAFFVSVARYPLKTLLEIYKYLHCIVQRNFGKWMESMQVATASFEEKIAAES